MNFFFIFLDAQNLFFIFAQDKIEIYFLPNLNYLIFQYYSNLAFIYQQCIYLFMKLMNQILKIFLITNQKKRFGLPCSIKRILTLDISHKKLIS